MSDIELEILLLSLKVAGIAIALAFLPALYLAWLFERKEFFGKTILSVIIHAPLVLPPVVIGYLLLSAFSPNSTLGLWLNDTFGFSFAFNWKGAALASGIMAFPLMFRAMRLGFATQNKNYDHVARTLGATPLRVFWTINFPLAFPAIITGLILGFARAFGEFGATISFVSNIPGLTQTLPLALFNALQLPDGEDAAVRFVLISLTIAFAALILSEILARRTKMDAQEAK